MNSKSLVISYEDVRQINLKELRKHIQRRDHKRIVNASAGKEHYKLLAYLSNALSGTKIVELGTHHGTGSLALCHNENTYVETWDLRDKFTAQIFPKNLKRQIGNILKENPNSLLEASLIFLDTDHSGPFEIEILDYLRQKNFRGFLLLDDIYFNLPMQQIWDSISEEKHDLTDIGHGRKRQRGTPRGISGTGLVTFTRGNISIIH